MQPRAGLKRAIVGERTVSAVDIPHAWFPSKPSRRGRAVQPLGDGHINDTYLVSEQEGRYVLQRINERVFQDPEALMRQVAGVSAHLRQHEPALFPDLVPTANGDQWHVDADGGVWRLWRYVEDAHPGSPDMEAPALAAAASAFARVQGWLGDISQPVCAQIDGFMQLSFYLRAFDQAAVQREPPAELRRFVDARRVLADSFSGHTGIVHGDCKLDNVMFDHARPTRVRAVLDLDTVMPGHWAWDFGDLARSAMAGANEPIGVFRTLLRGFRDGLAQELVAADAARAPAYVAFMLGVRFLTDHLLGDRYFRVRRRGDNLERARAQFSLVQTLERIESELHDLACALCDAPGTDGA